MVCFITDGNMGKNDLIECFNKQECTYVKCGAYNDTTSVCELEWLKGLRGTQAAPPSQVQAMEQKVPMSNIPFNNPPAPQESKQVSNPQGMTAGIKWLIKGNIDAEPTSPMAYTFVHKYDAARKAATTIVRDEVSALVGYLSQNQRFTDGIYDYTLSKNGEFINRYLHKEKV